MLATFLPGCPQVLACASESVPKKKEKKRINKMKK